MPKRLIKGGKRKIVVGRDALIYECDFGGWGLFKLWLVEGYEDGELEEKRWAINEVQAKMLHKNWIGATTTRKRRTVYYNG